MKAAKLLQDRDVSEIQAFILRCGWLALRFSVESRGGLFSIGPMFGLFIS